MADTPSQSINFSGSQITGNFQVGQAGGNLTQTQEASSASEKPLTVSEVVELIGELEALFRRSPLSSEAQAEAIKQLDKAKDEVQEAEPDKSFIAKSLQRATKLLHQTDETFQAGGNVWQGLETIATRLAPWLGVAAKSLLLL